MPIPSNPIPGGLYPGTSEDFPGTYFQDNYDDYPPSMRDEYDRQERRPKPVLSVFNVMLGVLCVFILAIGILLVTVSTQTVNTATGMRTFDTIYTVTNPLIDQSLDTGVFQITVSSVTYNDGAVHNIPPAGYSYSSSTGAVTVPAASINIITTSIEVKGTNSLSSPPTMTIFSILGAALIILSVFAIIGMLWFRNSF